MSNDWATKPSSDSTPPSTPILLQNPLHFQTQTFSIYERVANVDGESPLTLISVSGFLCWTWELIWYKKLRLWVVGEKKEGRGDKGMEPFRVSAGWEIGILRETERKKGGDGWGGHGERWRSVGHKLQPTKTDSIVTNAAHFSQMTSAVYCYETCHRGFLPDCLNQKIN